MCPPVPRILWLTSVEEMFDIGPAGQQTYRAYVLNIPTATTTTATTATTTTTAIFPNLKTKIVIT